MKTLLASVAVVAAVASPALAQDGSRTQDRYAANAPNNVRVYASQNNRRHSPNPAWDVYDTSGHYIGSDPDPTIRDSMLRESRGEY